MPYGKEAVEFLANDAINKIPGGSLLVRGAKYVAKRALNTYLHRKDKTMWYSRPS